MGLKTLLLVPLLGLLALEVAAGLDTMVGGMTNINENDPDLQEALLVAINHYNTESNDPLLYRISSISKAQSQLVAGTLYIVDLAISKTTCRKLPGQDLSKCSFKLPQKTLQCHVEVWVVPWLNQTTTLEFNCKP